MDRSGKLSWCSNGLTGAEVQVRLAMGARGAFLETDPRGELLDRAELAVCLDIIGAASAVRGEALNGVVLHARRRGRTGTTSEGHGSPGHVPPVEYEQAHYAALNREPQPV